MAPPVVSPGSTEASTGSAALPTLLRPSWRGLIHRVAVVIFVPASLVLVALAPPGGDRIAVAVYAAGVTAMLGVSAYYHSGRLSPEGMRRMKPLDHSTILLAIAGSYTAVATLALEGAPAARLMWFVWIGAIVGMAIRLLWLHAPYPVAALVYVVVGWGALLEWGALAEALSTGQMVLLVLGGVLYTVGAGVYAAHRPNPWPATFGYHEVFHAFVVGGVVSHLLAVTSLLLET